MLFWFEVPSGTTTQHTRIDFPYFLPYNGGTMLEYNQLTPKTYIVLDGEPYEVLSSQVSRKQQRKPVNQTKIRNIMTGKVTERSFHASEKITPANIEKRDVKYLYTNQGQYWFCLEDNPRERFSVDEGVIGDQAAFLKENTIVIELRFNEQSIGFKLPIKVDLVVAEAPPAVRGNTAQGADKQVTLETGAVIVAPIFINEGDTVRVNTETGEYTERVEKG